MNHSTNNKTEEHEPNMLKKIIKKMKKNRRPQQKHRLQQTRHQNTDNSAGRMVSAHARLWALRRHTHMEVIKYSDPTVGGIRPVSELSYKCLQDKRTGRA
jgi:hypothetical protein